MPDSDLHSIVYVSSAVRLLSPTEIDHLLARARQRNMENEITGVLLYIGGNFMQYIEGPKENLEKIYKIIREDKQHSSLILISNEAVLERQFSDWSMDFQTKDVKVNADSSGLKQRFEKNLEMPESNPSSARIVLRSFWNRGGS